MKVTCLMLVLFATCAVAQVSPQRRFVRVCTVDKPNESTSNVPQVSSYLSRQKTLLGTRIIGLDLHRGGGKQIASQARFRDCDYVVYTWSHLNLASYVPEPWADSSQSRSLILHNPYPDLSAPNAPSQPYSDYFPHYVDPRGRITPDGERSLPWTSYYELHRSGDKRVITRGRFPHHGPIGPARMMADSIARGLGD